ncbi:tumor necrosis factor alpha-induced protein 2-like [Echeneis naucrates]|uniref:tumor necrosis factor alpha-induced protein 2-like n=1 Tax=Echeneis naucrates TaxID=173247 RepID=UPI001113E7F2|nr:tumor necrosis factor alpha-induced protein 2-like [Echeneis naucrates]
MWQFSGGIAQQHGGERRKLPKLRNPATFWKKREKQNCNYAEGTPPESDFVEQQLEQLSRGLIIREEQLFCQDSPSEEEDQLLKDLEDLKLRMWLAIHDTFSCSSTEQLDVLRSAMAAIQLQEVQDQRWADRPESRFPVWRPLKLIRTHNSLLQKMVESRLTEAAEDELSGTDGLSSAVKRKVCRLGKRVRDDLLTVARIVKDCYPPQMDILNIYAAFYHQSFSARLTELAASGLETDDCSYLLFWVNHYYPHEILQHEDLVGKIKTACLGSLLLQDHLKGLEEQYLAHKEVQVKRCLNTALKKEEDSWLSGNKPELIDTYFFSPLAVDVIQIMNSFLSESTCVIGGQIKSHRITAYLETFLDSYRKSLEELLRGNHGNIASVIKAHLVCEEQFRDYITGQTGNLSEQQSHHCLETLTALRDCGYRYFTCPIHVQLKVCYNDLWTPAWLDGSLPVVSSLLDCLSQQLRDLADLRLDSRQSLLSVIHEELVLQYFKRMLKTRMKSKEQQVCGAERMKEDARMINDFFREEGCSQSLWFSEVLCSIAEVLCLQDPGSVQLEMVSLARRFPDFSDAHVLALLSLKTGLSATDVRAIRKSVEENRLINISNNRSPLFFSKVKVKWMDKKIKKMAL